MLGRVAKGKKERERERESKRERMKTASGGYSIKYI
jgi:hypothetical protein